MDSLLTVTVPASSRKLTTAAALRTELGETSAVLSDSRADDLITRASMAAERYCNRVFARETVSEVFRRVRRDRGRETLTLGRWPVSSITSVTEDGTALTGTDYEGQLDAGLLYRLSSDSRTAWCAQKTTVVYVAGYLLPGDASRDLPEDVEQAVLMLATGLYSQAGRDPTLRSVAVDGVANVGYALAGMDGSLPGQVAKLLDPFVRPIA